MQYLDKNGVSYFWSKIVEKINESSSSLVIKSEVIEITKTITPQMIYNLPLYYKVGNNSLEVYYCGNKLRKGIDYNESGNQDEISNGIQFTDNIGDLDMSSVEGFEDFKEFLQIVVWGDYNVGA